MLKQIKSNWFMATENDICGPDILFIRVKDDQLWHICKRKQSLSGGGEYYLCGLVRWDPTLATYHCSRYPCYTKLQLIDVWSDPLMTGYEGKA